MAVRLAHVLLCLVSLILYIQYRFLSSVLTRSIPQPRTCAIDFFGLPRSFASLVLPSLQKNVLPYNVGCDYFVHYYDVKQEQAGRSGAGGAVDPSQVRLLAQAVHRVDPLAHVEFVQDTETQFWKQYGSLIHKIRTANDTHAGHFLYFPWKARTYHYPTTTDNIVKMWHSIERVFRAMETYSKQQGFEYSRVGMMRSDMVYATPLDVWNVSRTQRDARNQHFVMASFGKFPVNDRLVMGPTPAVRVWALERFHNLDQHVQMMLQRDPGFGLHSERFVGYTLVPRMQALGYTARDHPTLCFLRARADESVWVSDCRGPPDHADPRVMQALGQDPRQAVMDLLGRSCGPLEKLTQTHRIVHCPHTA